MWSVGTSFLISLVLSGFFIRFTEGCLKVESKSEITVPVFEEKIDQKISNSSSTLYSLSNDIQNLWNFRKNSVVKIMGIKKGNDAQENLLFGTGFFADQEGHILTTATIVTEAESLWVEYQGLSYAATVIGRDLITNLAVIKPLKIPEQFDPIILPKSLCHNTISEGSLVISIACSLGMEPASTLGIIAGKNIAFCDHVFVTTYLRSNIHICGGECGAPVFNADGSFCGILIASLPELRSSFIIPECVLGRVFYDILKNKIVKYSSAGFNVRGKMSQTGKKEIVISAIDEKKIKYRGNETLKVGDIIRKIDGQEILNESNIADILFFKNPAEDFNISVIRDKETQQITVILSEKTI